MAALGNSLVAEKYLDIKAIQDLIYFQSANQSGQNTVFFLQETIKLILKDTAEISKENVQLKASLAQQVTRPVTPKKEEKDNKTPNSNPFDQAALQVALNRAATSEDAARKNAVHLQKSQEDEKALRARIDTLENENKFFKATKLAPGLSSSVLSEHDCVQCQAIFQQLIASGNTFIARIAQLEDALAICLKGKKACAPTPPGSPAHVCNGLTDGEIQQLVNQISQSIDNADIFILRIAQLEAALKSAGVQVPGSPTLASKKRPRSDDGNGNDDDDAAKDCLPKLAKAELKIADLTKSLSFAQAAFKQVSERVITVHQAIPNPNTSVLGQPAQDTIDVDELLRTLQRMNQIKAEMDRMIAEGAVNGGEDEDCKKKLEERDAEITTLKQRLADAEYGTQDQDKIRELNVKINGLQGEVRRLTRQLADCNARNGAGSQVDNDAATQDQNKINDLEIKNTGLLGEVKRLTQQLADCNAGKDNADQAAIDAATQQIQAQLDACNEQMEALQKKPNGGEKKPCKNCKKCKNCNCGSSNNAAIIQQLIADNAKALELLKQLNQKTTGNTPPASPGTSPAQALKTRLEDCYATSRTLFTKHHATLRELETAKKTITTLQKLLSDNRVTADTGTGDQNLQNQLRAAQEKFKTLQREYDDYKRSRKTFENKQRECEELEKDYTQAQNDLNDLRREKRDLTKKLADQTKAAEGHQDEVLCQIKRNYGLDARISELERFLAECNRARNVLPPVVREQGIQTDQENNADQRNDNDQSTQPDPAHDGDWQQQLDDCEEKVTQRDATIRDLNGQIQQLNIDIDNHLKLEKALTERAEIAEAAKDCDEIVARVNARIKELYEETLSLKADIDFHIRSLQIINARAAGDDRMQVDNNENDDEPSNHPAIQAATELAFDLDALLEDANTEIADLTATNKALTAQIAALGAAPDNAQELLNLVNAARVTLDQTRQEVIGLNIQITGLTAQIQTLTTERDALRARNVAEGRRPSGGVVLVVNNGGSRPNSPTVPRPDSPKSEGPGSGPGSENGNQGLADHIDELEQKLKDCEEKGGDNKGLIESLRQDLDLARNEARSLEEILDRVNNTIDDLRQEVTDEHNERWPARKTRQYKEAATKRKTSGAVVKRKKREDSAVKQKRLWKENGWHKGRFGSPPTSAAGSGSGSSSADGSGSSQGSLPGDTGPRSP